MSAIIYQFPAGGRAGLSSRREESRPVLAKPAQRVPVTACGSAWYHEEAMKDEEQTRKH